MPTDKHGFLFTGTEETRYVTVKLVDLETGEDVSEQYVTESPERFRLFRLCDCTACGGSGKLWPGRCPECRGEGRVRQEIATCASAEAVGVALVTLAREGEWTDCPFGLLDSEGETGKKWLILPWLPSARNVSDAGRVLAKSKKS